MNEEIKIGGRREDEDPFGNTSSTRKLRRRIAYFTLYLIAGIVLPIAIRIALDGINDLKIDYSVIVLLLSLVLILFTAAFVPAAFSQSKEWIAFIQTYGKKTE